MSDEPAAGWYPDPDDSSRARYWDGSRWTDYTGPREEGGPPPGAPPASAGGPARAAGARTQTADHPKLLGPIAWTAYSVLGFSILANLIDIPIAVNYADKVQTQLDTHSLTLQQASDAEDALAIGSVFWLISVVAGGIGFLIWWYRAYSNLPGITGHSWRFGRGWSIGAWFVPILSLWRPKQIGNDIWRGGDRRAVANRDWTALPISSLVNWWWGVYLLSGLLGGIAGGLLSSDPVLSNSVVQPDLVPLANPPTDSDLSLEHVAAIVSAISSVVEIAAAILAILFVRRASERQDSVLAEREPAEATT